MKNDNTSLRKKANPNFNEKQEDKVKRFKQRAEINHAIAEQNSISNLCGEKNTGIPMGQPILVGHHSEKRHRNVLDRIDKKLESN